MHWLWQGRQLALDDSRSPFEGIYELIVYYWNQTTELMDYILKLNTTGMREQVLTQWISYFKYFAQH